MSDKRRIILTVGQIAQRLNEPLHRIEYAIKSDIEPAALRPAMLASSRKRIWSGSRPRSRKWAPSETAAPGSTTKEVAQCETTLSPRSWLNSNRGDSTPD